MPAPLWEDAKNYLLMQGAPISDFNLNNAMNELAANPRLRPSYGGGPTNDMVANMGGVGPIQPSGDLGVMSPTPVAPMATQDTFDDRRAVNALAVPNRSSAPGPIARNAPARDARQVRAEAGQVPVPMARPPIGAPGTEPDVPGGAPPGPGQAMAGQPTSIPGSGSDDGMGLIGKILTGLGLAGGVAGGAMMMRGGATAGMRPRNAPGVGFQSYTGPGGGPGSGFAGVMSAGPGANPMTGTLPLGSAGGGGLAPSVTMPLPPPTVSTATHGDVPMAGYGPVAQTSVVPSGPPKSVPPGTINQGGPNIEALLTGPKNVTRDGNGPSSGGRVRSPRARVPGSSNTRSNTRPTPTPKPAQRNKGGATAADADQNDAKIKRNRAAQNRSR